MRAGRIATVLGLLALVLPGVAAAQGLGDAAARERARRAKQETAKKAVVFTNEDLDKGRPPAAEGAGGEGASSATASPGDYKESPPIEDRLAPERPYLDAIRNAQTRLSEVEARIQGLGAKLNPMSGSFIYGASGSNSANEEAEVRDELRQAESELNEARQAVVAASQALEAFRQGRPSAPPAPQ